MYKKPEKWEVVEFGRDAVLEILEREKERFEIFYRLLIEWNQKVNLTAIVERQDVWTKHFFDSLTPLGYEGAVPEGAKCIDVGTGAGFPAIPLLIARPDLQMTLVDSLQKRVNFLEIACAELGIQANCIHARAEELGHANDHCEQYDVAFTRAVAPLPVVWEWTIPFLKVKGHSIAYRGAAGWGDMRSGLTALGTLFSKCWDIEVPVGYGERWLIVANKYAKTTPRYPRKPGVARKTPL